MSMLPTKPQSDAYHIGSPQPHWLIAMTIDLAAIYLEGKLIRIIFVENSIPSCLEMSGRVMKLATVAVSLSVGLFAQFFIDFLWLCAVISEMCPNNHFPSRRVDRPQPLKWNRYNSDRVTGEKRDRGAEERWAKPIRNAQNYCQRSVIDLAWSKVK